MKLLFHAIFILALTTFIFGQQPQGSAAQNFTVTTLENETVELESLKGKVVLITFWSTRCPICVEEIPRLNKLVEDYSKKDVVFIGMAWQDKQKLDKFLAKKPFKFKIVPQSFGVLLKYAARDKNGRLNMGYPSHFLVDQNGTVVFAGEGFSQTKKLESKIRSLVDTPRAVVE